MAFKDFMKNATDAVQAKQAEIKKNNEIKKEEQARQMAEMKEIIEGCQNSVMEEIHGNFTGTPKFNITEDALKFTKEFYEKLLMPANSVSSSRITIYPNSNEINKKASKIFDNYTKDVIPVMQYKGNKDSMFILTQDKCYASFVCPENDSYKCKIEIDTNKISNLEFIYEDGTSKCLCNGVELFSGVKAHEFDDITVKEYFSRLETSKFDITEQEIDALIREKIGNNVLDVVKEYVFDDELLIYFAWGGDSITAKDFVVCTNKQIVILDRELIGAIKNVKQFYYEDITSMATDQNTSGILDLALTAMMKLCTVTISVAGAQEKIETLFTYEAERVIRVYQEYRRSIKQGQNTPVVIKQEAQEDDVFAKLDKLNKLKDAGILTDEEFNTKKQALLEQM